jgi:hypothetical protein
MTEQGSQFTCPQCGKPQFTAEFGFEQHYHTKDQPVEEPCVFCGKSTSAHGLDYVEINDDEDPDKSFKKGLDDLGNRVTMINPKWVGRVPVDSDGEETSERNKVGYACADCLSDDCAKCGKKISASKDFEVRDANDNGYHDTCLKPSLHHDCYCGKHPDPDEKNGCQCEKCN